MTGWSPNGETTLAAVIGDPVRHSLSPVLHNAAFRAAQLNWVYTAFTVAPGSAIRALEAMRGLGFGGLSVTMPHKTDVAALCDELTDDAAALQSVNCVSLMGDGRLLGDSTDGQGFIAALLEAGVDPRGRSVAIVGAGGAARAVALSLARSEAHVTVCARRVDAGEAVGALHPSIRVGDWNQAATAAVASDIIVNCTPVGMLGDASMAFNPEGLGSRHCVVDLVYTPLETPLLRAAAQAGAHTVDGLGMLIHQAALAFQQWTGAEASVSVMRAAALQALAKRSVRD